MEISKITGLSDLLEGNDFVSREADDFAFDRGFVCALIRVHLRMDLLSCSHPVILSFLSPACLRVRIGSVIAFRHSGT